MLVGLNFCFPTNSALLYILGIGENGGYPTHSFVLYNYQQRHKTILNLVDVVVAQWVGMNTVQA